MKFKYEKLIVNPHANSIIAWAMGAKIQYFTEYTKKWETVPYPTWDQTGKYRVKPDCLYSFAKIESIGGPLMVNLYKLWLAGGKIHLMNRNKKIVFTLKEVKLMKDPFQLFMNTIKFNLETDLELYCSL